MIKYIKYIFLLILLIIPLSEGYNQNNSVSKKNIKLIPTGYSLDAFTDLDISKVITPSRTSWGVPDTVYAHVFITSEITGDTIRNLYQGRLEPGFYDIRWYRDDDKGQKVENGYYYFCFYSKNINTRGHLLNFYQNTFKGKLRFRCVDANVLQYEQRLINIRDSIFRAENTDTNSNANIEYSEKNYFKPHLVKPFHLNVENFFSDIWGSSSFTRVYIPDTARVKIYVLSKNKLDTIAKLYDDIYDQNLYDFFWNRIDKDGKEGTGYFYIIFDISISNKKSWKEQDYFEMNLLSEQMILL